MDRPWLNELAGLRSSRPGRPAPRVEALEERLTPALSVSNVASGVTATQMANSLVPAGVTVTNAQFTGDGRAGGLFAGGTGIIGFESGVVVSNGLASSVIGPNNNDNLGTNLNQPGDPDLTALIGPPRTSLDATSLEFDFTANANSISFQYVFGSEEYNEFVNNINDPFGLFINGTLVSLVPGSNSRVDIETVNLGMNSQFYVNNGRASDPSPTATPLDTQLDGLTTVLTVTANITPGATNHFKVAVSDETGGPGFADSAVFVTAGSITAAAGPAVLTAYRPFRYAFRDLEQNLGRSGPPPLSGAGTQESFDGFITVVNFGGTAKAGDVRLTLHNLPAGVELLNRTGNDPATGDPFIDAGAQTLGANGASPLRVAVKLTDPGHASLGTFFTGPYTIEVSVS